MELERPKNNSTKEMDRVLKPAYKRLDELQKETKNEVGFFIRYDKSNDTYYADFFIGKSEDNWLNLESNPYNRKLGDNEMIIGFVHTHPSDNSRTFSIGDLKNISNLSLGLLEWTNVPKMADFKISYGWSDKIESMGVLHNNPKTINRMFFGVLYSRGYDCFSWILTESKHLNSMYYNIWLMGVDYSNRFLSTPTRFGADYIKRRK